MADLHADVEVSAGSRLRTWDDATVDRLLEQVDELAEIPRVLAGEVTVARR